ncbi:MAG: ABC transporter ATP-binding protein [Spirochaetales bacterium]|nr:ABC transporter ATP-binding protein [Spirochaetales bacterium]
MAFIELTNIDAGYVKGHPVLKDFHLTVEKGELVSLLGPSGCGKTTTLRTIAGFIMAEQGKVLIGGKDNTPLPPNKRNIGLVFQNYALFPHLTVFDNIAYGLRRRKADKQVIPKKVTDVLKLVSLTGYEKRLPSQLSGGQRQRVALARSIVIEPDLLLLDEPLSNLDAKLRDEMRAELSRLQHQLGITMIYVTHDQIEALSLSSRIVVMNEGNIEQTGTPEDIYERPATPFVARFVGFDNHLSGKLAELQKGKTVMDINGSRFTSTRAVSESVKSSAAGEQVDVFFRPEDVILSREKTENCLEVEIDYINYQGNTSAYALLAGDTRIRAVIPGKPMETSGSMYLVIPPEKIIVEKG